MFRVNKEKKRKKDLKNLLVNFPSSSAFAESYRTLRTNLFFSLMEKNLKSIVVTSSVEAEGKTTTAANLAYTIAQTEKKVLLIDVDLRRPHLSALLGMRKKTGITGLISNVFGVSLDKGTLKDFSVKDLIQLVRLQSKTCCLDLESSDTRVAIYFERGLMKDIYWKNRPESKRLASTLIKDKLLTKKEADLALGHQQKSARRIGTLLETMGFVSKKDISKVLSVHNIEAIRAVSGITTGTFAFSSQPVDEQRPADGQEIDFNKLYMEFGSTNGFLYLDHAIDSVVEETLTPNLFFLPAGAVPPNPSEILGSFIFGFLLDQLKTRFDFIIIDAPPVMPVTDALVLTPKTDGAVFVIKSGNTDRKIIKDVLDQFEKASQPIIGTVLNRVNMKKEGYYRYYKKYYSSYYGQ
ncbi:MAG: AAA family ATPase [Deltaproteobacteria bacterium]|nr:AAA family ATPase [Candidatus Desulfobacula maris]MBL6992380.1 AAA family ATPase [Desulfobacula sp.]